MQLNIAFSKENFMHYAECSIEEKILLLLSTVHI